MLRVASAKATRDRKRGAAAPAPALGAVDVGADVGEEVGQGRDAHQDGDGSRVHATTIGEGHPAHPAHPRVTGFLRSTDFPALLKIAGDDGEYSIVKAVKHRKSVCSDPNTVHPTTYVLIAWIVIAVVSPNLLRHGCFVLSDGVVPSSLSCFVLLMVWCGVV
jgi:hypothetical protein